ncbi:MAG: hypothetical protein ABEK16_00565 [Candidatus Nanohalobium sp.]
MPEEDEEEFFSFEPEEKEEKKSSLNNLEEKVEREVSLIEGKLGIPNYDFLTIFLVAGEVILILYGLLNLLG